MLTKERNTLIAAARAGDPEAIERLFLPCEESILRLCRAALKDEDDAEDAARDVLLKALERLRELRDDNLFESWLRAIAVHVCGDYRRRLQDLTREHEVGKEEAETFDETPLDPSLEAGSERHTEVLLVRQLLDNLPDEYRIALWLRDVEGASYAEIGRTLNCSVGKVNHTLRKARELFCRAYTEAHESSPGGNHELR